MSAVKLTLSTGRVTLVDPDVAEKFRDIKLREKSHGYVAFGSDSKYLHRDVMKAGKGMDVDHLNGDTLDNRRENLRICEHYENMQNVRHIRSRTGFLHVAPSPPNSWCIKMRVKKKLTYFGFYRSKYVTGIFADQIFVKRTGPFVLKNFPEKISSCFLAEFIDGTNGRIFKVVFSRRSDGRQRELLCRTSVKVNQAGGTIPFDPISLGLFSVYDVQKRSYRFIPLENVICIRFAKTNYRVVA